MRPALLAVLLALAALPSTALAQSGGATAPGSGSQPASGQTPSSGSSGGGTRVGDEAARPRRTDDGRRRPARRRARLAAVIASFDVQGSRFFAYGSPIRTSFRVSGRGRSARLRLAVLNGSRRVASFDLGERALRQAHTFALTSAQARTLPEGRLTFRLSGRDARGRRLRRGARASGVDTVGFYGHRFPLVGAYSYGGDGGRFGADRGNRSHQGQDLSAAEGTPVVAPRGGTVKFVQYQAAGAGHYIVIAGAGESREYAFMHLQAGSIQVRQGQTLRTGQRLASVGNTGRSFGARLHFQIWQGAWQSGGRPIDPLPHLRRWDSWS